MGGGRGEREGAGRGEREVGTGEGEKILQLIDH